MNILFDNPASWQDGSYNSPPACWDGTKYVVAPNDTQYLTYTGYVSSGDTFECDAAFENGVPGWAGNPVMSLIDTNTYSTLLALNDENGSGAGDTQSRGGLRYTFSGGESLQLIIGDQPIYPGVTVAPLGSLTPVIYAVPDINISVDADSTDNRVTPQPTADGAPISGFDLLVFFQLPAHGSAEPDGWDNANQGYLSYTPNAGYVGSDSFGYWVYVGGAPVVFGQVVVNVVATVADDFGDVDMPLGVFGTEPGVGGGDGVGVIAMPLRGSGAGNINMGGKAALVLPFGIGGAGLYGATETTDASGTPCFWTDLVGCSEDCNQSVDHEATITAGFNVYGAAYTTYLRPPWTICNNYPQLSSSRGSDDGIDSVGDAMQAIATPARVTHFGPGTFHDEPAFNGYVYDVIAVFPVRADTRAFIQDGQLYRRPPPSTTDTSHIFVFLNFDRILSTELGGIQLNEISNGASRLDLYEDRNDALSASGNYFTHFNGGLYASSDANKTEAPLLDFQIVPYDVIAPPSGRNTAWARLHVPFSSQAMPDLRQPPWVALDAELLSITLIRAIVCGSSGQ